MGKKGKCYSFHFCCHVLLFDFLKFASLCSLIKLVNILPKNAASKQKEKKMISLFTMAQRCQISF